jgi:GNAT superfamily N-acetyltransferase
MDIELKAVRTSADRKAYALFPFSLFKHEPLWVPPILQDELKVLDPAKNPSLKFSPHESWIAYRGGRAVGRITVLINTRLNEAKGEHEANFHMFDFIDDIEVSGALLERAAAWAGEKGATALTGPLGFHHLEHLGFLAEGFEELPTIAGPWNPPYYIEHLQQLGYEKKTGYIEFRITVPKEIPDKLRRLNEVIKKRSKLTLVNFRNRKEVLPYAHEIFGILNEAYRPLSSVADIAQEEIEVLIKQYFSFVLPQYVKVVKNEKGDVVGFGLAMHSMSRAFQKAKGRLFPFGFIHILRALKYEETLDLYLVGVLPEYQSMGVPALLIYEILKTSMAQGIKWAETTAELEDNHRVQELWSMFERRQHKARRIYRKLLT